MKWYEEKCEDCGAADWKFDGVGWEEDGSQIHKYKCRTRIDLGDHEEFCGGTLEVIQKNVRDDRSTPKDNWRR